jgi:hypothetical protein
LISHLKWVKLPRVLEKEILKDPRPGELVKGKKEMKTDWLGEPNARPYG